MAQPAPDRGLPEWASIGWGRADERTGQRDQAPEYQKQDGRHARAHGHDFLPHGEGDFPRKAERPPGQHRADGNQQKDENEKEKPAHSI